MNKKRVFLLFLWVAITFVMVTPAVAQSNDYMVHLRRNFGYGGGVNIRGTFTISLVGEEDHVAGVTFLIDGDPMIRVNEAPFRFKFQTDDYGFGMHLLSAEVTLNNDTVVETPALQYNFISPSSEREQIIVVLGGVVGAIIVTLVAVAIIQSAVIKTKTTPSREPDAPREYGLLGGTLCPKCGRAFPRHIWGINLIVGRLDRCDNCGQWVTTQRATPAALRAAEKAEREADQKDMEMPVAEPPLKDILEDSKYIDGI